MRFETAVEGGHGRRRSRRRGSRWGEPHTTPEQRRQIRAWVTGRVPGEWGLVADDVRVDDDEVLVLAHLAAVTLPPGATPEEQATAEEARIGGFREETRGRRMQIAEEGAAALGRIVSWGAVCGETTRVFTTASVPVMTRLRIEERLVLDTLVDAGVARSRSDALAWCVRLVGANEDRWIADLRSAFAHVEEVRARGPQGFGSD